MVFRRFLFRVTLLVVLIALAGLAMVWSFMQQELVLARFTFSVIWILLIIALILYVTRTNRVIHSFLESLRYLDSVRVHKGKGRSFEDLEMIYNEIIGIVRKIETEKETNRQYYRSIIDHAGVGILAFDDAGNVEMENRAFLKMTGMPSITNISSLSSVSDQLPELLKSLKPGSQKLVRITANNETGGFALKMAGIRMQGRNIRVASLQNIQQELEEEELDAWQKLIRVLTHEIVNSITPVNSLTKTIIRMFETGGKPKTPDKLDESTISNALEGLHSIENRNKGLVSFVQSYRSLTRVQKPNFAEFRVNDLCRRIGSLVQQELESRKISLEINVIPDGLDLTADEKLIEQVLINMVNNAIYALGNVPEPRIKITAKVIREEVLLEVHDNGAGIPQEIMNHIFIPFFTTRQDGSGIGLSLSRQIMRVHSGSMSVRSKPGETIFTLRFPMA